MSNFKIINLQLV